MLVGRVGIEPTAVGLKDRCSTTELPARHGHYTRIAEAAQTDAIRPMAYHLL